MEQVAIFPKKDVEKNSFEPSYAKAEARKKSCARMLQERF